MAMDMSAAPTGGCNKQATPCPDCAKKICPELALCLVKCANTLPSPAFKGHDRSATTQEARRIMSVPSPAGTLIPPLIRPPIV